MTFSGSNDADPAGLVRRAGEAFDILCGSNDAVGVAVSGGSDSLSLLLLASEWARAKGKRIAAATVDHGLRPEAADEAQGVTSICAELGVPHTVLSWQRTGRGPVAQAEARRARHVLLAGWAAENGIRALALGHTRDDRIETFLMRARQGSGWRGLAGPLPSGPSPVWPEGRGLALVRPILAFGREELRGYLRAAGRIWVEDPSNDMDRFERVRVRRLVGRMDASSVAQALRVMDGLAHMRAAVAAEARQVLAKLDPEASAAEVTLSPSVLRSMNAEAQLRLVEALVMAAGGAENPPRREALDRLVRRLCAGEGAVVGMTLAGAWVRIRDGDTTIGPAPPRRGAEPASAPDWTRAAALLADPGLAALAV